MCKCVDVNMGTNQRKTTIRNIWYDYQLTTKEFIDIDTCLVQEIIELWECGIRTIECCCGHNKVDGYIAVVENPDTMDKMKLLGYVQYPHPELNAIYYPRSTKSKFHVTLDGYNNMNQEEKTEFQKYIMQDLIQLSAEYRNNWAAFSLYLENEKAEGKFEFRLVVQDNHKCYIHPTGKDGKTFDFEI